MELISDWLDYFDALAFEVKLTICVLIIFISLVLAKYTVIEPWKEIVKDSSAGWDDLLVGPLSVRLYMFILAAGAHLSCAWLVESDLQYNTMQPYFGASYIMITTSIASVSIKILMPVFLDGGENQDSVKVSGGSPFLVLCTRASVYFVGLYLALLELELNMFALLAPLAVVTLIIGIAMKQTISNIANSFLLAIDQPFEVGDRVEIEGNMGTVASIGVLSTKLLTRDEKLIIIPNNTIVYTDIINHARGGGGGIATRKSLIIDIGVSYDEDVSHVKFTLLRIARQSPHCLKRPEPRVLVNELDEFTKNFRLFVWVENYNEEYVARDWLLKSIDENFTSEGITISYPTEVEIDKEPDEVESSNKEKRQEIARKAMLLEEEKFHKDREDARRRLKELEEEMMRAELDGSKVSDLEFEAQAIETELGTFEREG